MNKTRYKLQANNYPVIAAISDSAQLRHGVELHHITAGNARVLATAQDVVNVNGSNTLTLFMVRGVIAITYHNGTILKIEQQTPHRTQTTTSGDEMHRILERLSATLKSCELVGNTTAYDLCSDGGVAQLTVNVVVAINRLIDVNIHHDPHSHDLSVEYAPTDDRRCTVLGEARTAADALRLIDNRVPVLVINIDGVRYTRAVITNVSALEFTQWSQE